MSKVQYEYNFSELNISRPLFTFDFTYNLMRSFILHTEDSINKSIAAYTENAPEVEKIEIFSVDNIYEYIQHYKGVR